MGSGWGTCIQEESGAFVEGMGKLICGNILVSSGSHCRYVLFPSLLLRHGGGGGGSWHFSMLSCSGRRAAGSLIVPPEVNSGGLVDVRSAALSGLSSCCMVRLP